MRRRFTGLGAVAWLVAFALPAPTGVAAQESSEVAAQPRVEAVDFRGNRVFPDDSLRRAIVNRAGECRTVVLVAFCWLGFDFARDQQRLVARELGRDVARLRVYYYQRGYRDARVDTTVARTSDDDGEEAVRLVFDIEEGPPVVVDTLTFLGAEDLPDGRVLRDLPLSAGDPLSAILLEATKDTLENRLRNDGFAHVDVVRNIFIPRDTRRAEVEYDIFTGPRARFGEITVEWPDDPSPELSDISVRRLLPLREGDRYSKDRVFQAQRNLFGLELVRNASVVEDLENEPDSLVPMTVQIQEGDLHRVRAGVGWSESDCVNAETSWSSRNFLGGARRLQIRGRVSNVLAPQLQDSACPESGEGEFADFNWLLSVELLQPWLVTTRNSLTASVFAERQSLPDIFIRKAVGVNVSVNRTLSRGTILGLSYRPQLSTLDAAGVFFCTTFLACAPRDIDVLQSANWLAPVGATITRNRTDNLLNPSDGFQLTLDLEHASSLTGSNFGYNRLIAEAAGYQQLARRTVAAARVRVGWVGSGEFGSLSLGSGLEVIHPQKRFYAGGANSMRGFPQNRLGPRVLTADVERFLGHREDPEATDEVLPPACTPEEVVELTCDPGPLADRAFFPRPTGGTRILEGNVEYRFAFGGEFQGVTFLDFGQVWGENDPLRLKDVELAPGIGVRYFSPIGPIRVDVGYRFRGDEDLQVVTQGLRPFVEGEDDPEARLRVLGPDLTSTPIPWIKTDQLALLDRRVLFGEDQSFFRRLQLHFSIGQAF